MHILLAEDNKADVFLMQEALAAHGVNATVHVVEDGEEAIRFITRADGDDFSPCPTLYLLDLNLPKRSGREILAHIRQSKKCASAPVIIVTSSDSEKDKTETQRLGANGYFKKPSNYEEFLQVGALVKKVLHQE